MCGVLTRTESGTTSAIGTPGEAEGCAETHPRGPGGHPRDGPERTTLLAASACWRAVRLLERALPRALLRFSDSNRWSTRMDGTDRDRDGRGKWAGSGGVAIGATKSTLGRIYPPKMRVGDSIVRKDRREIAGS
jgi:hypothetical protein